MRKTRQITIATDLSVIPSRDFLVGVLQYAHDRQDWNLRVLQSPGELTTRVIREIEEMPDAGLITTEIPSPKVADKLAGAHFPLVLVGTHVHALPGRTKNIVRLSIDETAVGRLSADHLLSFGRYRSCVFVPALLPGTQVLSPLREDAFCRRCARTNAQVCSFRGLRDADFPRRLAELPRPIAILAETAERGQLILHTAAQIGLEIPRQCVLAAIESDSLVCSATTPRLSNIYPNATIEGIETARRLDSLFERKTQGRRTTVIVNAGLVFKDRETSASISPSAALVQRATELIEREAVGISTAEDLAARLGVSRRLLDLRFSACCGKTASAVLRETKLSVFTQRLRESNLAVEKLAPKCGFPNASYLKTLFRRQYGETPGSYRKGAHRKTVP